MLIEFIPMDPDTIFSQENKTATPPWLPYLLLPAVLLTLGMLVHSWLKPHTEVTEATLGGCSRGSVLKQLCSLAAARPVLIYCYWTGSATPDCWTATAGQCLFSFLFLIFRISIQFDSIKLVSGMAKYFLHWIVVGVIAPIIFFHSFPFCVEYDSKFPSF